MKGSEIGSAAFREPPSGGPRKAELELCPESRSQAKSVGSERKNLTFSLKVTRVRQRDLPATSPAPMGLE